MRMDDGVTDAERVAGETLRPTGWRWLLAAAGLGCFGLGAVGAVVPGMPTTIFLIMGSWCLARSCPALERKLLALPLFRPFAQYLRPGVPMPRRARLTALVLMWAAIAISVVTMHLRTVRPLRAQLIAVTLGVVGTVAIVRFRRTPAA